MSNQIVHFYSNSSTLIILFIDTSQTQVYILNNFLNLVYDFQKGYFTENCCVLAEGRYCSDRRVFFVTNMALPPCERTEISK